MEAGLRKEKLATVTQSETHTSFIVYWICTSLGWEREREERKRERDSKILEREGQSEREKRKDRNHREEKDAGREGSKPTWRRGQRSHGVLRTCKWQD